MANKTWKARERGIGDRLNGKRKPCDGSREGVDVETPLLVIQAKHGHRRPSYLAQWLNGIAQRGLERQKVPLVIWSVPHERTGEAIVLLRMKDFEALHGQFDIPPAATHL